MPDGDILDAVEERRGHGRDDYPVVSMWRTMLAGIVFQHESAQSLTETSCSAYTSAARTLWISGASKA